jgi:hypothetical protein
MTTTKQAAYYVAISTTYPRPDWDRFDSLSDASEYADLHGCRVAVVFTDGTERTL